MVNWHRMSWFGAVWGESYGFLCRGVLGLLPGYCDFGCLVCLYLKIQKNGLSVVNQVDNYPLSRDVPGNAIDNNRVTDYLSNDIVDSVSVDSNLSIDAYPLVKDKDPPERIHPRLKQHLRQSKCRIKKAYSN